MKQSPSEEHKMERCTRNCNLTDCLNKAGEGYLNKAGEGYKDCVFYEVIELPAKVESPSEEGKEIARLKKEIESLKYWNNEKQIEELGDANSFAIAEAEMALEQRLRCEFESETQNLRIEAAEGKLAIIKLQELEKSENQWKEAFEWSDNLSSKLAYALDYAHQTLIGNDKQKELKIVSDEIAVLMKDYLKYHPKNQNS